MPPGHVISLRCYQLYRFERDVSLEGQKGKDRHCIKQGRDVVQRHQFDCLLVLVNGEHKEHTGAACYTNFHADEGKLHCVAVCHALAARAVMSLTSDVQSSAGLGRRSTAGPRV